MCLQQGLTLLFYIALHCKNTKPSCLDLPKEFVPVGEAFSYPYDMLTGDVAKIVKDIDGMMKFAKEAKECKDPADKWEEQIGDFAVRMEANKGMLDDLINRLGAMSCAMCTQFCDSPSPKAFHVRIPRCGKALCMCPRFVNPCLRLLGM